MDLNRWTVLKTLQLLEVPVHNNILMVTYSIKITIINSKPINHKDCLQKDRMEISINTIATTQGKIVIHKSQQVCKANTTKALLKCLELCQGA